jgi:hypothetical protein
MREIDVDFAAWARARQLRLHRAACLVGGDPERAFGELKARAELRLAAGVEQLRQAGVVFDAHARILSSRGAVVSAAASSPSAP